MENQTVNSAGATEPFAYQAAKFSLYAPIIMVLLSVATRTTHLPPAVAVALGIISIVAYASGFFLAIYALISIRKYGTKGLLGRSILGLVFNGLILFCMVAMIPVLMKARAKAKAIVEQRSKPFSFKAPDGFSKHPAGLKMLPGSKVKDAYVLGNPNDAEPDVLLFVEDLGGHIPQGQDMSKAAAGRSDVSLHKEKWKTFDIDVFEIREDLQGTKMVTYNAQVPTLPNATQIKIIGLESRKDEIRGFLRQAIANTDGGTNWR